MAHATTADQMGLDPCSSERRYRPVAQSLTRLGAPALPAIERALDSLEQLGAQSEFATNGAWVVLAYAHIRGASAYPRLRRMAANPKLAPRLLDLDGAVAVSLGLTDYVSAAGAPGPAIPCDGTPTPRHAFTRFLSAWVRNDPRALERTLGENARGALQSMRQSGAWSSLRSELGPNPAAGYRFESSGRWAQPAGSWSSAPLDPTGVPAHPALGARFTDRDGRPCGRHRVAFSWSRSAGPLGGYLVDNTDFAALLRQIAACAAAP